MTVTDTLQRPLRDLRISVTDRCNFRCVYCMPKEIFGPDFAFLPREEILSFEEIERLTKIFVDLGVRKLRITGGEPTVRHELETLIGMLASIDGVEDIAMTTNAVLLPYKAEALKEAGLGRITISLDAIEDETFGSVNGVGFPVARVLDGIEAAESVGLSPIKINMVVKRGMNDHQILPMADHFRHSGHILRFIEFMDVGNTNGWRLDDVVSAKEIVDTIHDQWPIEPLEPNYTGEVANRYRYADGAGEIGIIGSVSQPFCRTCTRARLTADGELFTCLFGAQGRDMRTLLRSGASDEQIQAELTGVWRRRGDRYSELRTEETAELTPKAEMSRLGG
ncbi:MAG: GTP 3',8-cyclase MoaA [Candidatus Bipolaricaulia bacterium]